MIRDLGLSNKESVYILPSTFARGYDLKLMKDAKVVVMDYSSKVDKITSLQMIGRGSRARGVCEGVVIVLNDTDIEINNPQQAETIVKSREKACSDDCAKILPGILALLNGRDHAMKVMAKQIISTLGVRTTLQEHKRYP